MARARLRRRPLAGGAAAAAAILQVTCATSITSSTTSEDPLDPGQPRNPPFVTVSAAGVSPVVLHVDSPVTVTFTNEDAAPHRLESAPELGWDDCPELRDLDTLAPGGKLTVTLEWTHAVCAYHEATHPADQAFQGYIAVH